MVISGQVTQIRELFGVQLPLLHDARIFSLKAPFVALRTNGPIVTSPFVPGRLGALSLLTFLRSR